MRALYGPGATVSKPRPEFMLPGSKLGTREPHAIGSSYLTGIFHPISTFQLSVAGFFFNATSVYVSKTSEIKNGHPARP